MSVDISYKGLEDAILALQATPRQVRTASRCAVSTVTRQTNRALLREMAAGAGVTQRLLRLRRRVIQRLPRASEGDRPSGSVWVGQMPLPAAYLATNAQRARVLMGRRDRGVVRIGRRFYPGGLWAGVGVGGHVGVFTRRGRAQLLIVVLPGFRGVPIEFRDPPGRRLSRHRQRTRPCRTMYSARAMRRNR